MKTLATVKTTEKAIEILQSWLTENANEDNLNNETYIEDCETRCECGQTHGMKAYFEAGKEIVIVAICESCGDDDSLINW